jgi:hypothetical protein
MECRFEKFPVNFVVYNMNNEIYKPLLSYNFNNK